MGISSTSNSWRPGVIANASARPSNPFEGQVVYQTDTNQTLVWDGAAWVDLSTGTTYKSGLVFIKQSSTLTSNRIEVLNCFVSEFNNYKIIYDQIIAGSATGVQFELYDGSNWTTSGFYASQIEVVYATTTVTGIIRANNSGTVSLGGVASTTTGSGWIEIQNVPIAKRTGFQFGSSDPRTNGAGAVTGSGFHNADTVFTGFRLSGVSQNLTGGTVRVYGYNQ